VESPATPSSGSGAVPGKLSRLRLMRICTVLTSSRSGIPFWPTAWLMHTMLEANGRFGIRPAARSVSTVAPTSRSQSFGRLALHLYFTRRVGERASSGCDRWSQNAQKRTAFTTFMCRLGLIAASLLTFAACSRDQATRTRDYIASGDAFERAGKY